MANQGQLGNKLSEKLQFPQKGVNYLCDNSCRFLGGSTTESNQCHWFKTSSSSWDWKSSWTWRSCCQNDLKTFLATVGPEVEVHKISGNPLEYKYFSAMFKEVVERKMKDPVDRLAWLIKFLDGGAKDLIKTAYI